MISEHIDSSPSSSPRAKRRGKPAQRILNVGFAALVFCGSICNGSALTRKRILRGQWRFSRRTWSQHLPAAKTTTLVQFDNRTKNRSQQQDRLGNGNRRIWKSAPQAISPTL